MLKNRLISKLNNKLKRYGLTDKQYQDMIVQQDNRCKICREAETRVSRLGNVCSLMIDHCHMTKKVRGLLCHRCNTGLGSFRDRKDLLQYAIRYLSQ